MKNFLILISGLALMLFLLQCAGSQKPDPAVEACKSKCENTFSACAKKAVKNEAKKAACEAVRNKCVKDCAEKQ